MMLPLSKKRGSKVIVDKKDLKMEKASRGFLFPVPGVEKLE